MSGRKIFFHLMAILIVLAGTLALLEGAAQIVWRIKHRTWFFQYNKDIHFYRDLFQPHPYLVVAPKPNVSLSKVKNGREIVISHNNLGFRGKEPKNNKFRNTIRIVALGGSSTYCISVSDHQTWPYLLEKELGNQFEVINLGVPGYSTVENIIQLAFIVPELAPQICLFYVGWNDIRNVHIDNLKSDYSDFHGKTQYYNLRLDTLKIGNYSALLSFLKNLLESYFTYKDAINVKPTKNAYSENVDYRALDIFARNIRIIIALCKNYGILPIFIPQILNKEKLANDRKNDWAPFLKNYQLIKMIEIYNSKLTNIVQQEQVIIIKEFLTVGFTNDDFLDEGHFNAQGNLKFARIVSKFLINDILPNFMVNTP